jgi:hypothetical protein
MLGGRKRSLGAKAEVGVCGKLLLCCCCVAVIVCCVAVIVCCVAVIVCCVAVIVQKLETGKRRYLCIQRLSEPLCKISLVPERVSRNPCQGVPKWSPAKLS